MEVSSVTKIRGRDSRGKQKKVGFYDERLVSGFPETEFHVVMSFGEGFFFEVHAERECVSLGR